jgi:hypothetical protein
VLTAVVMNAAIFWDVAPCCPFSSKKRAGGRWPGRICLIFDTEDEGDTFLRNVGSHTDYAALYPRRCATFITVSPDIGNFPFLALHSFSYILSHNVGDPPH